MTHTETDNGYKPILNDQDIDLLIDIASGIPEDELERGTNLKSNGESTRDWEPVTGFGGLTKLNHMNNRCDERLYTLNKHYPEGRGG